MSDKLLQISIDGHVTCTRDGYREYLDPGLRAQFDEWKSGRDELGAPDGVNVASGIDPRVQWDDAARWRALESQGVAAEVLYPNGMPFVNWGAVMPTSPTELEDAGRRAYNRWLVDFCALAPERRVGVMVTGPDIDQSVEDVHWAKEQGLGGVLLPPSGDSFYFEEKYDPFWAACAETGLVATQHGGSNMPRNYPIGFASIMTIPVEAWFFSGRCVWQMILGGVFERYPELKLVVTEGHVDWMPAIIRWLDWLVTRSDWLVYAEFLARERNFSRLPSEYFAENCYAGGSFLSRAEVDLRDDIGIDHLMFGTDFPHTESTFPNTRGHLQGSLGEGRVTEEELRKILGLNAAQLYGLDAEALHPDVERCGFTIEEILASGVHIDDNQPGLWHLRRPPLSPSIYRPWSPESDQAGPLSAT